MKYDTPYNQNNYRFHAPRYGVCTDMLHRDITQPVTKQGALEMREKIEDYR